MAEGVTSPIEQLYLQLSSNSMFGTIAFGGDSQAVRTDAEAKLLLELWYENARDLFGWDRKIYAVGGMTHASYLGHQLYMQLKASDSNIVCLMIGGNDIDSATFNRKETINASITMFNELTSAMKIVYVCEIPGRFSCRTPGLTPSAYNKERRAIRNKLQQCFRGRYIGLPSYCFNRDNFDSQYNQSKGMWEYVHLKKPFYSRIACSILEYIRDDLLKRESIPATKKIDLF